MYTLYFSYTTFRIILLTYGNSQVKKELQNVLFILDYFHTYGHKNSHISYCQPMVRRCIKIIKNLHAGVLIYLWRNKETTIKSTSTLTLYKARRPW